MPSKVDTSLGRSASKRDTARAIVALLSELLEPEPGPTSSELTQIAVLVSHLSDLWMQEERDFEPLLRSSPALAQRLERLCQERLEGLSLLWASILELDTAQSREQILALYQQSREVLKTFTRCEEEKESILQGR